jgi:hypothetical protein
MINITKSVDIFYKLAQSATTSTNFLYNNLIKEMPADINLAITQLNAGKSKMDTNASLAKSTIDQIVQYLRWRLNTSISDTAGKKELIPTDQEVVAIINTGIFGPNFILSLTKLLGLTNTSLYNAAFAKLTAK